MKRLRETKAVGILMAGLGFSILDVYLMYWNWELCIVANGVILLSAGIIIWIVSAVSNAKKCVKSAVSHLYQNDKQTNHMAHDCDSDIEISKLLTQLRFDILRMSAIHDDFLPTSKYISEMVTYRAIFSSCMRNLIGKTNELQEMLRYDVRY